MVSGLTQREIDTLECLADGMSLDDTAVELSITRGTVQHHRKTLFRKLQARNAPHAVAKGYQLGYLKLIEYEKKNNEI